MVDDAIQLVSSVDHADPNWRRGADASFYPINSEWGAKLYPIKEDRDICKLLQQYAADRGLAPQTKDDFKAIVDTPYGQINMFGMITERADLVPHSQRHNMQYDKDYLYNDLFSIGIDNYDLHWRNVGLLRGKLVCIDFNAVNLSYTSEIRKLAEKAGLWD